MARTPISDLVEALKAIKTLQETVLRHDETLSRILDRIEKIEAERAKDAP